MAGASCASVGLAASLSRAAEPAGKNPALAKAFIDGRGEGWRAMVEGDFENVNCKDDTFAWKDSVIYCTGKPVGVVKSKKSYKNLELVVEWRHMRSGGNSGV